MKGQVKLLEYLNESEDWFVSKFVSYDDISWVFRLNNWQSFHYTLILSKEYGFIKRLVEKRKIKDEEWQYMWTDDMQYYYSKTDLLIMILSIKENPVEFLISVLK